MVCEGQEACKMALKFWGAEAILTKGVMEAGVKAAMMWRSVSAQVSLQFWLVKKCVSKPPKIWHSCYLTPQRVFL